MASIPPNSISRVLLILSSTVVGAWLGFLLLPTLFDRLPNELMRTKVLLHALHGEAQPAPQLAVLGNSIAMNGINTQQLSTDLDSSPVSWNLSSTGQLLIESTLIADELPQATDTVVLTLFTDDLVKDSSSLPSSKLIAYLQYGYQPNQATIESLQAIASPEVKKILDKSKWQITLDSRWALRSAIDISCRGLLRKDLDLENATTSLFYPSPYTRQQSPEAIQTVIENNFPPYTADQGRLSDSSAALIKALAQHLQQRNISLCIALLPEHPLLRERREAGFYENLLTDIQKLGDEVGVPVFSFLTLLDTPLFIDQVHPNAEGAQILTQALAKEIAAWQAEENN